MIFKTITLHNIFSYYGSCSFPLEPPADNLGNIVVIMGRNGFGKTSLLNSIKLLFGGVTEELRQSVQRDKPPTAKGFVIGDKDWWGILNHQAKIKGDFECFVSAILLDDNHREYEIKRTWNLYGGNYQSELTISAPRKAPLVGEDANNYLSALLPLDYIPFFFFDAEEIGYLAEANRNKVIERMEQLLNIRPADNLKECIKRLTRKIERDSIAPDAKLELVKAENRQSEMRIHRENLQQEMQTVGSDIEILDEEIRELRQKLRLFSGQGAIENNAKLEATRNSELKNQENALTALSEMFERDAFLRLNSKQIQKTLPVVDVCVNGQRSINTEMLGSLREPLKEIFTTPPYPEYRLTDSQIAFYQKRITKLLDSRDIEDEENIPFRLDIGRAKKLLTAISAYAPQHTPEQPLRDLLSQAIQADNAINDIDKTLQDVRLLSDENKQQLLLLQDKLEQRQDELNKLNKQLSDIVHKLPLIDREIKPLEEAITRLTQQARQSEQSQTRIELLDKMQKLLAAYKQQLKERQRGTLEKYFNSHLNSLLDSNSLISEAKIDELFQLHYLDISGNPVAMSSISAGMKQLAATALLWALKDACGRQLPVIIDTPLGRIDKQHQDNLLNRYYPHAAKQVILLPTDSELDERKHRLLEPYIYREFHLYNPAGENTEIREIPRGKEIHYG